MQSFYFDFSPRNSLICEHRHQQAPPLLHQRAQVGELNEGGGSSFQLGELDGLIFLPAVIDGRSLGMEI
jgi:hypothetical protein